MAFKTAFAAEAERDFELIFEFLVDSYLAFGETMEAAIALAEARVQSIIKAGETIAEAPYRGTLHNQILPGLRHVTIGKAIYWFDIDEDLKIVRILAIFFGGQDHVRHMLKRLLE